MKINVEQNIKFEELPSQFADFLGINYTSTVTKEHKKEEGQFFTPQEIANFMGKIAYKSNSKNISILDPGCGTAILTCALIENLNCITFHQHINILKIMVLLFQKKL